MANLGLAQNGDKSQSQVEYRYRDDAGHLESTNPQSLPERTPPTPGHREYKVYKRRWFGLMQLVLLNIIVSWDVSIATVLVVDLRSFNLCLRSQWLSYSPVANTAATFFSTSPSIVNWLSTSFLFAFVVASPVTFYILHKSGPRLAIIIASVLILLGNWFRYGGTRSKPASFGLVMFGQILIGLAQPFVLAAPTAYSGLWFSPRGRVSATAIASLANPFGGALGQLINPFLATSPSDIPNMTLYIAIISSVATIPSFFIPRAPPTPVSASSTHMRPNITRQISLLVRSPTFWLVFLPFSVYVGFFNSLSSLLTQILTPYNYSETESGIAGALLILVGLVAAAITSPIIDRSKAYLLLIRILVPIIAIFYVSFIWAPPSKSVVAPYIICSILGAASFSLVPVALEWLVEVTWPVGPELSSVVCWAGGQLLGGVFIIISDALEDGGDAKPPFNMHKALVFEAVVACVVVPAALALGWVGEATNKRLAVDKGVTVGQGRGSGNGEGEDDR